jgi:hypothetical protein
MIKPNALRKYGAQLLGVSVAWLKCYEPPNKVEEIAAVRWEFRFYKRLTNILQT